MYCACSILWWILPKIQLPKKMEFFQKPGPTALIIEALAYFRETLPKSMRYSHFGNGSIMVLLTLLK